MRRRSFLILSLAFWPAGTFALAGNRIPRIGYLSPRSPRLTPNDESFLQGLRELGYIEGNNIFIEYRFADGRYERLPALAAELVKLDVDIIVSVVTQASLAVRDATTAVPIVMVAVSDPVSSGLVASLARPGANITGTSSMSAEVVGKSLEVFKEAVPVVSRVAVLWNPANAVFQTQMLDEAKRAADILGVEQKAFGARDANEISAAFEALGAGRFDGLLVLADPLFIVQKARLMALVEKSRLPAMYGISAFVESGGLMSYGPNIEGQFRRAASYVDRILRGARPGDLPIEQPTQFELVLNLAAARKIGLTFPLSLLGRADEVIE